MTSNALKIHLDRYERDVLPLLSPRTQKDYGRAIAAGVRVHRASEGEQ